MATSGADGGDGHRKRRPDRPKTHRFSNPPGTPTRIPRRHRVLKLIWRQRMHAAKLPLVPEGHLLQADEVLAQFQAHRAAGQDAVTWLGHAAMLLRLGGKTVLIDPFLSEYASPIQGVGPRRFVPPALTADLLPQVDVLLVSHNHYDHLDAPTIDALPHRRTMQVVVPLGLGRFFRKRGFRHVTELDWHHEALLDGLKVILAPAIHRSARGFNDGNRTLWGGFILETVERRVYFGGDTGYGPVFKETGRRYGAFDLAIIGIGAYAPRAAMHQNHADPEEAVQIAKDLGASHVMAMHWGTIIMTTEPPFEPPRRFRIAALAAGYASDQAWVLRVGETRKLPKGAIAVPVAA